MFGGNQPGKHINSACRDGKVMISTTIALASIFHNPHTAAFRAIIRCELFKKDDTVRDTVHGLVINFSGEVIEHQHGGTMANEIVLNHKKKTAIPQRALG